MQGGDTLLIAGSTLPYLHYYPKPGQARIVQIDRDATSLGLHVAVDVPFVGDVRRTLTDLLPLLQSQADRTFLEQIQATYRHVQNDESRIYEVDLPSTQRWKRDCLRAAEINEPAALTFVPTNFESSTLAETLMRAGLRRDEPAFFSWLGVTMYLAETAFMNTMRFIGWPPPGSGVVFDYAVPPALLPARERKGSELFASRGAEKGEPWKLFFELFDQTDALLARIQRSARPGSR
jgi:Leucine carboxyl methyltransferase